LKLKEIMKTIGLRATPREIYYAIIEKDDNGVISILSCSKLIIPLSLIFPEQLNFVRKNFKDIILEYSVENAGIRIIESTSRSISIQRISFEAILQELLSNSSVMKYFVGQISNISSKIGFPREQFKLLLVKNAKFDMVENWDQYDVTCKEAILVGLATLNL